MPAARLLFVSIAGLTPAAWAGAAVGHADAWRALAALGVAAGPRAPGRAAERATRSTRPSSPGARRGSTACPPTSASASAACGASATRTRASSAARRLWQLAAERRVPVAALDWPVTVGAALDALLPDVRPTRRGERYADVLAGAARRPPSRRGSRERARRARPRRSPARRATALLVDLACEHDRAPRARRALLLLRLTQTEPALLRADGPGSAQARAAFARRRRRADAPARLLRRARGCSPTRPWRWSATAASNPSTAWCLPNVALAEAHLVEPRADGRRRGLGRDRALERRLRLRLRARRGARRSRRGACSRALARRSGAFRVVPAAEMLRLGADPEAWFGLDAAPGFAFGDAARGPLVGAERGARRLGPARAGRRPRRRPSSPSGAASGAACASRRCRSSTSRRPSPRRSASPLERRRGPRPRRPPRRRARRLGR